MNPTIIALGILLLMGIGLLLYALVGRTGTDKATQDRLNQYVGDFGRIEPTDAQKEEKQSTSKLTKSIDEALESQGFVQNIQTQLAQANLRITPTEYMLLVFVSIVSTAALAFLIYRNLPMTLLGAVLGFFLPRFYLGSRKRKRLKMFNDQLGDAINLMANGLRSGYSILQAMESVSTEMPDPIAEEFQRVVREVQLGVSTERAMNNMVRRIPSDDLDLMVTAINIQHEVGGNLAEILEVISFVIRERVRIAGEIRTLTAQGMLSGYIISLLPIILSLLLYAMNHEYMGRMFLPCAEGGPTSCSTQPCGWIMSGFGIILIITGFLAIQKVVKIDI